MRAHVRGTAGHSSFAPAHVNALEYAARIVAMIQDRGRAYAVGGPFDREFTVPHATMLATMIEGGVATNVTPDYCAYTFELRGVDETRARADMDALLQEAQDRFQAEMQDISLKAGIQWEEIFSYPAMGDATGTKGFEAVKDILPEWGGKVSFGSEGGVFEVIGGIPSVIIGPGSIRQAHKADEFIEIDQVEQCLRFLDMLVELARE